MMMDHVRGPAKVATLLLALVGGACSGPGGDDPPQATTGSDEATSFPTTTTGDPIPTTTGDSSEGPEQGPDEVLLRAAIAGEADPAEALQTISDRGGLPVSTASKTFLFACLCGDGTWSLAGDHNNWQPEPLDATGPLWWTETTIATSSGSLYKYVEPETDTWIADPMGRRYGFDDFGRYSLVRASAAHFERWYNQSAPGLLPRNLQVLVPDDGEFTRALYVHDGQNLFDPNAIWGGWRLDQTIPPGVLVVGLDNTAERMADYTHVQDEIGGMLVGGKAELYADFIEEVVRPRMTAAYGEPSVVGVMGSSLGGLVSLVIAERYPDRYAMALSMSGTLGWGSLSLVNETIIDRYATAGKQPFAIYLDSGGNGMCADLDGDGIDDDGPQTDNYCTNAQMRALLTSLGYVEGTDLWYSHTPDAPHNEAAWAARVGPAMTLFANLPAPEPPPEPAP